MFRISPQRIIPKKLNQKYSYLKGIRSKRDLTRYSRNAEHHQTFSNPEIFLRVKESSQIKDRVALVLGGNDELGQFFVREFLEGGAKGVMVSDEDEERGTVLINALYSEFLQQNIAFIRSDYSKENLLHHAFSSTINHFGGIDIIVNIAKALKEPWEKKIDKNIKGLIRSSLLGYHYMSREQGGNGGTILNVIDTSFSDECVCDECPVYVATRDFLASFGRIVSCQMAETTNVKVLTLCGRQTNCDENDVGLELPHLLKLAKAGTVWSV